ncbi:MAG: RnfABCDGE type electron transport complex subunit D [Ruminococcaceae bacterium]|nr:RnfABCDGE type electron transport complex subunit D [Oscillospiraceae bacterium]
MDNMLRLSASPHIHSTHSTKRVMIEVALSLLPAAIAGIVIFGLRALAVILICIGSCVLSEFVFNIIIKKEQSIDDFSAVVTGLLLALNLPSNIPFWQAIVGSVFAIVVVKCCFGGIGKNIVNPAITARVFMLIAFGEMAKGAFPAVDTVSSATPLATLAENGTHPDLITLLLGNYGGAIGETCTIALLIGAIYLALRNIITWHIPVAFIGTTFLFTFILVDFNLATALAYTLSGGLFIGAIFMATDYVTSPATWGGQLLFGALAGVITVMIRIFGNYPEGVSFAILFMNILTPYIDIWTSRKIIGGETK